MDEGDAEAAWKAFHQARRDEPDNLGIGLLEVQLLMAEDKYDLAQQRAAFLVKRLNRLDIPDSDPMLGYLRSIVAKSKLVKSSSMISQPLFFRASRARLGERSKPVTRYPRFLSQSISRPEPQPRSRIEAETGRKLVSGDRKGAVSMLNVAW
ncbi:MAG: hypothetical protein U9R66_09675 [Thermodesulfobacteriota bacterium]|nr:hypothetical protein [Thermodesulfobacteriota bacterium]